MMVQHTANYCHCLRPRMREDFCGDAGDQPRRSIWLGFAKLMLDRDPPAEPFAESPVGSGELCLICGSDESLIGLPVR